MTIGTSTDAAVWAQTLRAMALILTADCERADDLAERTLIRALASSKERPPELTLDVWMLSTLHKCHWNEPSEDRLANQANGAPSRLLKKAGFAAAVCAVSGFSRASEGAG
jgi:hypothetical protein